MGLFINYPTSILWNVTPLLGDFGGRVGFCVFYRALLSRESPLSLQAGQKRAHNQGLFNKGGIVNYNSLLY